MIHETIRSAMDSHNTRILYNSIIQNDSSPFFYREPLRVKILYGDNLVEQNFIFDFILKMHNNFTSFSIYTGERLLFKYQKRNVIPVHYELCLTIISYIDFSIIHGVIYLFIYFSYAIVIIKFIIVNDILKSN